MPAVDPVRVKVVQSRHTARALVVDVVDRNIPVDRMDWRVVHFFGVQGQPDSFVEELLARESVRRVVAFFFWLPHFQIDHMIEVVDGLLEISLFEPA